MTKARDRAAERAAAAAKRRAAGSLPKGSPELHAKMSASARARWGKQKAEKPAVVLLPAEPGEVCDWRVDLLRDRSGLAHPCGAPVAYHGARRCPDHVGSSAWSRELRAYKASLPTVCRCARCPKWSVTVPASQAATAYAAHVASAHGTMRP